MHQNIAIPISNLTFNSIPTPYITLIIASQILHHLTYRNHIQIIFSLGL